MRITISILAILFGLLHIIAAQTQLKSTDSAAKSSAIAMLCGGVCTAAMAVAHLVGGSTAWMDAPLVAMGCLLVCAAAYENGRRAGGKGPSPAPYHSGRGRCPAGGRVRHLVK